MDLQNAHIKTAGAYIPLDGRWLFTLGPKPHQGCTPIVRIGGHREGDETGWQCAVREVAEESTLQIEPLVPPFTCLYFQNRLEKIRWPQSTPSEAVPLLAVASRREDGLILSLMYLVRASGLPQPANEVKGLLLPTAGEIHRLCGQPMTLAAYLASGGQAILNHAFDASLPLKPFIQLQLLSNMLLQGLLPG